MKRFRQRSQRSSKFKSKFEETFAKNLEKLDIPFDYEKRKIKYLKEHTYSLDFEVKSCILIETKGYFTAADRQKMLDVKKANPELDIRLVFMADQKLHKLSNTRYSDWCNKHGFKYTVSKTADLPKEWIKEIRDINAVQGHTSIKTKSKNVKKRVLHPDSV